MSEPFIGEIRMFAGTFAPRGWALCEGQLLPISNNQALFSLLGTIYGGDGRTTFGLPDLRGRLPIHKGQGAGLSNRQIGSKSGAENVTLIAQQVPPHNHSLQANSAAGDSNMPVGRVPAKTPGETYNNEAAAGQTMAATALADAGGNQPHSNLQPALCLHFIIALIGVYPSRS